MKFQLKSYSFLSHASKLFWYQNVAPVDLSWYSNSCFCVAKVSINSIRVQYQSHFVCIGECSWRINCFHAWQKILVVWKILNFLFWFISPFQVVLLRNNMVVLLRRCELIFSHLLRDICWKKTGFDPRIPIRNVEVSKLSSRNFSSPEPTSCFSLTNGWFRPWRPLLESFKYWQAIWSKACGFFALNQNAVPRRFQKLRFKICNLTDQCHFAT